jgi:hypothetical protein
MKQTFEDYCRQLKTEADALAQEAEMQSRFDHLQAFNFGRTVGRIERAHAALWLRVRWLLLGAAAGVTLGAVGVFLSVRIG